MAKTSLLGLLIVSGLGLMPPHTLCAANPGSVMDISVMQQKVRDGNRVTLDLKNVSPKKLLDEIHKQTGLDFIYNTDQMAFLGNLTVRVKQTPALEVLNSVFGSKGFQCRIEEKMVTIARKNDGFLRGTIFERVTNEPVIGASIMVKGTTNGTITDVDGNFQIKARKGQHIVVNYIGMEPLEFEYSGEDVSLYLQGSKQTTLDDVVVTGIFKKAKESYTGSVTSISTEDLQKFKGQNMLQTLKNIDASINFTVNNLAGSNPNALPNINIRGNSSLPTSVQEFNENMQNSTNTPLIVMDGFEITLTKLMDYNDDEIESINILKDASATAIYGSRGANGVIVVISKRPEAGSLKVNLEVGTNIQLVDLSSYHLLNASEKLQLEKNAGLYDNEENPGIQQENYTNYYKRLRAVLSGVNTNWLHKPVRTGVGQTYKARLEGGNDEFRWGTSLSYNDVQGVMKGSSRKTFNGSVTLMYNLKNLLFRNYTSFGVNNSEESKYGSFSDYVDQQPYNAPYDENGKLVRYFDSFWPNRTPFQNPLYDAELNSFDKTGYQEFINNFSIEWNLLKELTLRGQLGISTTQNTSDYFLPAEHSYFSEKDEYSTDEGYLRRGMYRYGVGRTTNFSGNVTLSYNKLFNDAHQVYVGANYDISEYNSYMDYFTAEGFSNEDMNDIINAHQYAQDGKPSGSRSLTRRVSLTGNANYTYNNLYYLDLSYRVDGSSLYGSEKKYAPFWSTGIGWNLHNEKFLKGKTPFNSLRLKTSYGETGSQLPSNNGAHSVYQYQTGNKYMNWNGAYLTGFGNKNLTWQTTKEFNVGLEFGIWDNRIKGAFDVYSKATSNLLSSIDIPLSMGYSSYVTNIGEVKNNGWEASLSGYVIRNQRRKINWILSSQLIYNKNKISKLYESVRVQNEEYMKQGADVSNLFFEGYPQNSIYAVQSLGIDPSTGDEIFIDRNGNKTKEWNAADKVYQGSYDPLYRGNLGSTFIWDKLTVNLSFGYYWGGKMYNSTLLNRVEVTNSALMSRNVDRRVLENRWYNAGDLTFFKAFSDEETRATSRYVMDNNVLELQSVSVQYRWDTPWVRNTLHANAIIFGVNVSDVFHLSTVRMERGTSYPFARTIQGSLKLSF